MAIQDFFVSLRSKIQQACASGRWVRTLWNSLAATVTRGFRSPDRTSHRAKRTFSERYLLRTNFAKLELRKINATKRPRRVYYIPMFGSHHWLLTLFIIRDGVGWLSCLFLSEAMRRPVRGISDRKYLPRPFHFHASTKFNRRGRGKRVGKEK